METPVCDFVKRYADSSPIRLHMPGHKGKEHIGAEKYDITEIDGADVLYHAEGIIKKSEENASELYGTGKTLYSAEGSSLSIRAMLYLALIRAKANGRSSTSTCTVLAGRNAHKTFMTACALLGFDVEWLYSSSGNLLSCEITAEQIDNVLAHMESAPAAVYITSPDYLGNTADIRAISAVCRKRGVLLLVDNAHGAYLGFLPESRHPISLGADMCCDSAHKTLPVLTGGAYLHISKSAPSILGEHAENAMSVFASTSPSYLIIQSLDAANRYLAGGYRARLAGVIDEVSSLKEKLVKHGYKLAGDEPLKLTVCPKEAGYTGVRLAEILAGEGIVCEFADPDFTVMMFTPEIGPDEIKRLENALLSIEFRAPILAEPPRLTRLTNAMTIREAMLSPSVELPAEECEGKILAAAGVSCPPAIPIVVCGEVIDKSAVEFFRYYGVTRCRVVDAE
ncbi:MAG: amino acid decarboxylase [Eubacteriales bacterium]